MAKTDGVARIIALAALGKNDYYTKDMVDEALNKKQNTLTAGDNIVISEDNVISADLPIASADTLGGIKIGENLTIDENGVVSASSGNVTSFYTCDTIGFDGTSPENIYDGTSLKNAEKIIQDAYEKGYARIGILFNGDSSIYSSGITDTSQQYNNYIFYGYKILDGLSAIVDFVQTFIRGTWENDIFTCTNINNKWRGYGTLAFTSSVLTKTNTSSYTPTSDYNPATKKYVDDGLNDIKLGNITPVYCLKLSSTTNILEVNRTITSTVESELQEISKIITDAFSRKGFMLYVATTVTSSYVRNPAEFYVYTDLSTHPTKIYGDGQKIYRDINDEYATYLAAAIVITGTWVDDVFTATEIYIGGSSSLTQLTLDTNVLTKNNTTSYTPTANYHPATKKYVDDAITTAITTSLEGSY